MDYSQKQIIDLDNNFSFYEFLEGAKKAFNLIVVAYKAKKLEEVKELISREVFKNFKNSIEEKENTIETFNINSIEASILNIEVVNKIAKIKVEFFSNQEEIIVGKKAENENIKDIWTFEKNMQEKTLVWTLVEVGVE